MSSQKKLIWLLSKDQDYINFTVYGVPDGLSRFYLTYIWYIIFIIVSMGMFFVYYKTYTPSERIYAIVGIFICLAGIAFNDMISNANWVHKSKNNKFFIQKGNMSQLTDYYDEHVVVLNPENLKLKNLNELQYAFPDKKTYDEFKKKHNLKTISLNDYLYEKAGEWDTDINNWGNVDTLWVMMGLNTKYVTTILLTFCFVVAKWNMKIFYRIFPWVTISLFAALIPTIWYKYGSFVERNNVIFFEEKIQMLSSYFAIYTLILFMGFSQK